MLIVGNQKNYMTTKDVKEYLSEMNGMYNVVICPSNIYMPYYLKRGIHVGIQNIVSNDQTITGEITARQARSMGIEYAIIGHSERRENYAEDITNAVNDAIKYNLNVILCIGENLEDYNNNETNKKLKRQISELINISSLENIIIAYEPVWAIGTGKTPSNEEIEANVSYIKRLVKELYGIQVRVLYGGSVSKENIETLRTIPNIDGFLIGKASTKIYEFKKIIEVVND